MNRETGQPPHLRYHQQPRLLRQVDLGAVLGFFHQRVPRLVDKDFSDVPRGGPVLRRRSDTAGRSAGHPVRSLLRCRSPALHPHGALRGPRPPLPAGKGEVIPSRRPRRLPDRSRPTISMPCGPNTLSCKSNAAAWASTTVRHDKGTCGPVEFRACFRPFIGLSGRRIRAGRAGNGSPWPPSTPATIASPRVCSWQAFEQAPAATLPEVLFQLQSLFPERND